jgi:hypothetical protein
MKDYISKNYTGTCLLLLTIVLLSGVIFHLKTADIELEIAYKGYGPHDYVARKINPENFQKDFYSGTLIYDYSLPMRVFYYIAKLFKLHPTLILYPFAFLQILLFALSVAFVSQMLFGNKLIALVSVIIVFCTPMAGLNLSRFGYGFGLFKPYLYYNYANAFRFFAFGFFLRNRYIPCFFTLALSIYCHVNMGVFALVFISAYLLYQPALLWDKSFRNGLILFLVLILPQLMFILSTAVINSETVDVAQWVKATRIFSFHWYPITMKLFTYKAQNEFFPILMLCCFFFVFLRYHNVNDEKHMKVIIGCCACLVMSVVGIVFSDIYPIPFLIRMSPQRSTGLITFFVVLYLIYYLYQKALSGNFFTLFLVFYSLCIIIASKPGFAILPFLLLFLGDINDRKVGVIKIQEKKVVGIRRVFYGIVLIVICIAIIVMIRNNAPQSVAQGVVEKIYRSLWGPLKYFDPFRSFDFILRGGRSRVKDMFPSGAIYTAFAFFSVVTSCLIVFYRKNNQGLIRRVGYFGVIVVCVCGVWYLEWISSQKGHKGFEERALAFLDVQLWAERNTSTDALFLPDPSHGYGWRDFSQRSSFGSLREWGYTGSLYRPSSTAYLEGKKRMKEFGIDIDMISYEDIRKVKSGIYGQILGKKIRGAFYGMKPRDFSRLSRKYGIDYLVMNKKYHKKKYRNLKIAYENKHYIVYRL